MQDSHAHGIKIKKPYLEMATRKKTVGNSDYCTVNCNYVQVQVAIKNNKIKGFVFICISRDGRVKKYTNKICKGQASAIHPFACFSRL